MGLHAKCYCAVATTDAVVFHRVEKLQYQYEEEQFPPQGQSVQKALKLARPSGSHDYPGHLSCLRKHKAFQGNNKT